MFKKWGTHFDLKNEIYIILKCYIHFEISNK